MNNYATYSPEDNKLRLYVGRVPRDEYERLRREGWTSTPKQDCDFVAVWTPDRRDTALEYADLIEDEDQGPEDRAADRAERFAEYRDKRTEEATGHADRYDDGPRVHGFQSQARGERAAARHDRIAGRACDAWSKAEYWQRRTAGVISHALYASRPDVRMGRIKEIEAELRKREKWLADYRGDYNLIQDLIRNTDPATQTTLAIRIFGSLNEGNYDYKHPRPDEVVNAHVRESGSSLYTLLTLDQREYGKGITGKEAAEMWLARHSEPREETEWTQHLKFRIAYELQMLEAQGGRAAFVEMVPGGFIGSRQIQKVNKSPVTGRTVSVTVLALTRANFDRQGKAYSETNPRPMTLHTLTVERLPEDAYRAPTDEELAAFEAAKKEAKKAAPKKDPCPLINPTDEDAERLQAAWNERAKDAHCESYKRRYGRDYAEDFKPSTVCRITQAAYSANSKGSYARAETRGLCADMVLEPRASNMWMASDKKEADERGPAICQVRQTQSDGSDYGAPRVIVLTDKPQKPLPAAVWKVRVVAVPAETFSLHA